MKYLIFIAIIILSSSTLTANGILILELKKGNNIISINEYFHPIQVSYFINLNKKIESITQKEVEKDIGYINIFGGIGTDFFLQSNKTYEIYSSEDIIIYLNNY